MISCKVNFRLVYCTDDTSICSLPPELNWGNETKQAKLNDLVYVTKRVLDANKTSVTRVTPAQHDCSPSDMSARRV